MLKRLLFVLLFILAAGNGWCATYYVRTDGHDGATGLNNTTNASTGAWQTLVHACTTIAAGDTLKLKDDQVWNENCAPPAGFDENEATTITRTGDGTNKPIILPSALATGWVEAGGIYSIAVLTEVITTWEDTIPLQIASSAACADGNWFWAVNVLYYKPTTGVAGDHTVRYTTESLYTGYNGVDVSGHSYITVDGIKFLNAFKGITGVPHGALGTASNITVQNCDFYYSMYGFQNYSDDLSIGGNVSGNYFYRVGLAANLSAHDGLGTQTFDNWTFSHNTLVDVGTTNGTTHWDTASGYTMDLEGISAQNLSHGTISDNDASGGYNISWHIYALVEAECSSNSILRNKATNNGAVALQFAGTSGGSGYKFNNNTIAQNIFINAGGVQETVLIWTDVASTEQNYFVNNIIYGGPRGVYFVSASPQYFTVKNNIFYGGSARYVVQEHAPEATFICDYNFYSDLTGDRFYSGSGNVTWAQWQAAGYDTHGLAPVDPLFVNAPTDFHLKWTSPARNAGSDQTATTGPTDFDGRACMWTLPIGAYCQHRPMF